MYTTRTATTRQLENKLQVTLKELQQCKALNEKLLHEQEDSEKGFLELLDKNKLLKNEMSEMHVELIEVTTAREQLQVSVQEWERECAEHDTALRRIDALEGELRDAHTLITQLQSVCSKIESTEVHSLYDKLVGTDRVKSKIINTKVNLSKNQLKKYLKIKRFIKKNDKLTNKNKLYNDFRKLRQDNQLLQNELSACTKLKNTIKTCECDTLQLQSEITRLNKSLYEITYKYTTAQKEMTELTRAMDELLELSKYNEERFESLTNIQHCSCHSTDIQTSCSQTSSPTGILKEATSLYNHQKDSNIIVYSDESGRNMGSLFNLYSRRHKIINNCFPYASLDYITKKISTDKDLTFESILILFIGDKKEIDKNNLTRYYDALNKLCVKRIILFTIPYNSNLPTAENDIRYKLNLRLYNSCAYNCKFHLIDINKYVNKHFKPLRGSYYLSTKCKIQIATSLLYYTDMTVKACINNNASIKQTNINQLNDRQSSQYIGNLN